MDGGEAGPVAEGTMPSPAASVGLESTPSRSDPQSLCTRINGNLLKLLMPRKEGPLLPSELLQDLPGVSGLDG